MKYIVNETATLDIKSHIVTNIERHIQFFMMMEPSMVGAGNQVLRFLGSTDNPFDRSNLAGHITCSAFVVNQDFNKTLLIHHKNLQCWLQPGGHMDTEEYPVEAAVREAREETGIDEIQIWPPGLIDIDVHTIPANPKKQEPEHTHYDLRYLCVALDEELSPDAGETNGANWFDLDAVIDDPDLPDSIKRMAKTTKELNQ